MKPISGRKRDIRKRAKQKQVKNDRPYRRGAAGKGSGIRDGEAFSLLWEGKWQDSFASQSEADLSLCCKLAFWSGKDKEQMDRLFRRSALYRDKWDEKHHASGATYGEETLNKAIEATETTYSVGGEAVIFEYDGRYFRSKGENIYPITNFYFSRSR
jgi:primase-polymerase (primpol)-like protein